MRFTGLHNSYLCFGLSNHTETRVMPAFQRVGTDFATKKTRKTMHMSSLTTFGRHDFHLKKSVYGIANKVEEIQSGLEIGWKSRD